MQLFTVAHCSSVLTRPRGSYAAKVRWVRTPLLGRVDEQAPLACVHSVVSRPIPFVAVPWSYSKQAEGVAPSE